MFHSCGLQAEPARMSDVCCTFLGLFLLLKRFASLLIYFSGTGTNPRAPAKRDGGSITEIHLQPPRLFLAVIVIPN